MLSSQKILWLAGYVVVLALLVMGLLAARRMMRDTYSGLEAHADWQEWRETVSQQSSEGASVRRRIPKSESPPGLVLMNDYFGACLVISIVLVTALYGTLVLMIRGVWSSPPYEVHEDR
ncbi:MAG: hypothetical protein MK165_10185 [Pirellulaceae bacterium]|nr:hypothetical protein [Pirellulaceae bacterium]